MNLLEAKMFEYFFYDQESKVRHILDLQYLEEFRKQLQQEDQDGQKDQEGQKEKHKKPPYYKILWESNNNLFFCNIHSNTDILYNSNVKYNNYSPKYYSDNKDKNSNFEFLDTKIENLWISQKPKLQKYFSDNPSMNSLEFFDYVFNKFEQLELDPLPKNFDQTIIFNVQKFDSSNSQQLDFLKVGEDFELNPVSLVEDKLKEALLIL